MISRNIKPMQPGARATRQSGFILTMELVLIITILGIGLLVGLVAIKNELFVQYVKKKSEDVYVSDSTDPPIILGKARDFDEHEAPRLFYIDRGADGDGDGVGDGVEWPPGSGDAANYRAMTGVRDDRFTTRHRIFYRNSYNCGADGIVQPCIVTAGNELGDDRGVGIVGIDIDDGTGGTIGGAGRIAQAGGISYLYPLQGGPSYGIGRDLDNDINFSSGMPGELYREDAASCDPATVHSVWTSQTVIDGEPCESLVGGITVEAAKCPDGRNGPNLGDSCLNPADSRCVTTGTCTVSGLGCFDDGDCLAAGQRCSISNNLCTVQADCNGSCSASSGSCAVDGDCTGSVLGNCEVTTTTSCTVDADCPDIGQCENSGNLCANNGDCQSPPGESCITAPETCLGAVVDSCVGYEGICTAAGVDNCNTNNLICGCPTGWVDYGANCCPAGSTQDAPGQCTLGDTGEVVEAVPVGHFNAIQWTGPFRVNLPVNPDDFYFTTPNGGEGGGYTITDQKYIGPRSPDGRFEFIDPDGEASANPSPGSSSSANRGSLNPGGIP